jgi:hypothetical protein
MHRRRAGDARERMGVGLQLPNELTGLYVQRVNEPFEVAKHHRMAFRFLRDPRDDWRAAHARFRVVAPIPAAGFLIERVHAAGIAAHEHTPRHHRWL